MKKDYFAFSAKSQDGLLKTNTIKFHDSLLLLPASLNKLADSFGTESKTDFDINRLNSVTSYTIRDPLFNNELLEYNKKDCKVLFDILSIFADQIYSLFKLNITSYPTLSSLALNIYRSNFMDKNIKIPITSLDLYDTLKPGYTGGHVDVYKPYGENMYCYDVNSLYPSVMEKYYYPSGQGSYFEGYKDLSSIFGFVHVKVTAPSNLNLPILLTKIDGSAVAPLGNWRGWYFTEELKNAIKHGYTFEMIEGYTYERNNIFKDFVNTLYQQRMSYSKKDPRNLICKLILNTLQGRFGLSPILEKHIFQNPRSLYPDNILDVTSLDNGMELISLSDVKNKNLRDPKSLIDISLPIAMAVAAYARMDMANIKMKYKDSLYYSDTDSIFLDIQLPEEIVNNGLGEWKLESAIKKAVFIAPKVYSLLLKDGSEVTKIKGSKVSLSFSEMKKLLIKDSAISLYQEKWHKNLSQGNINIRQELYTLAVTENKRVGIRF